MSIKGLVPLALIVIAGSAAAATATHPPAEQKPAPHAAPHAAPHGAAQVRDWSRVDTNRDHLVSPEEMEKYLADNPGPLKKTS